MARRSKLRSAQREARPAVLLFLRNSLRALPSVLLFFVVPALVTLFLIQFLTFAGTSDAAFRAGIAHEFAGLPQERAAVALARTFPKSIAAYGAGLLFVQGVAGPGERFNYFFGEISGKGHALYFPVALGIKLTTATVLLVLAAPRRGGRPRRQGDTFAAGFSPRAPAFRPRSAAPISSRPAPRT